MRKTYPHLHGGGGCHVYNHNTEHNSGLSGAPDSLVIGGGGTYGRSANDRLSAAQFRNFHVARDLLKVEVEVEGGGQTCKVILYSGVGLPYFTKTVALL